MDAPAEVSKLDRAKGVEQVLWLDVPVDDILRVDIFERLDDLKNVIGRFFFRISLLGSQVFVELSFRAVLEDEVDLVVIEEEAVKLDDMWVP